MSITRGLVEWRLFSPYKGIHAAIKENEEAPCYPDLLRSPRHIVRWKNAKQNKSQSGMHRLAPLVFKMKEKEKKIIYVSACTSLGDWSLWLPLRRKREMLVHSKFCSMGMFYLFKNEIKLKLKGAVWTQKRLRDSAVSLGFCSALRSCGLRSGRNSSGPMMGPENCLQSEPPGGQKQQHF